MLDIVSDNVGIFLAALYINGEGILTDAAYIDTADFSPGVTYYFAKQQSNGGDSRIFILESDTVDGEYTEVPSESIIGSLDSVADAVVNYGESMPSVGVFSNKRFLRLGLEVTGGGVEPGDYTIILCLASVKREILPYV